MNGVYVFVSYPAELDERSSVMAYFVRISTPTGD